MSRLVMKRRARSVAAVATALTLAVLAIGASAPAAFADEATTYALSRNPFRYGGEYRDATCGTDYLRARWYLADQQTFLSRDPADVMHRYGYTGGDPIGRSDPSGLYSIEAFGADVGAAINKLAPGGFGVVEPLVPVWGQVLGGMQLLAALPSFWHPTAQTWTTLSFLVASVATEGATASRAFDRLDVFDDDYRNSFRARMAIDSFIGASQSAASAKQGRHFDTEAFIEGLSYTSGSILTGRVIAGIGYRPFEMTAHDVAQMGRDHAMTERFKIFVLSARQRLPESRFMFTSPLLDKLRRGRYEEYTVGVTATEQIENRLDETTREVRTTRIARDWNQLSHETASNPQEYTYQYLGRVPSSRHNYKLLQENPLGYAKGETARLVGRNGRLALPPPGTRGNLSVPREQVAPGFGRHSHRHAAAIRQGLGF